MARDFIPPLKDVAFQYGFNTDYLKKVIHFWRTKYNWRAQEKYLNSLPQFKIEIGQLNIHFIHAKPPPTNVSILLSSSKLNRSEKGKKLLIYFKKVN